jgi:hypothetical protein
VIHGKTVSVGDELRIGQENVDKHGVEAAAHMAADSHTKLRFSHHGRIPNFDKDGYPLNIGGRTGAAKHESSTSNHKPQPTTHNPPTPHHPPNAQASAAAAASATGAPTTPPTLLLRA